MKSKALIFAAGLAAGVVVALAIYIAQSLAPAPSAALPAPDDATKKSLAKAEKRLSQLEAENARLTAELVQHKTPPATPATEAAATEPKDKNPFAAFFGGGSDTNRTEAISKMIKASIQQQVDMKVSALKLRLHLTDQQEQAVRDLLNRQMGMGADVATKMLQGKLSKEEMEKLGEHKFDLDGELKGVLSADQFADYEKYKVEERQTQAQMVANVELMQLQTMLNLSQEQQDKVFNVLYGQAEKQVAQYSDPTQAAGAMKNWEQQFDAKKEALKSVLTPEQFTSYEKYLDSQRDMIKAFLPGGTSSSDVKTEINIGTPP